METGARAFLGFHLDASTVCPNDDAYDAQAQPMSVHRFGTVLSGTVKPFKDVDTVP